MEYTGTNQWMTPEEALSRFNSAEMTLLDLSLPAVEDSTVRYGFRYGAVGFLIGETVSSEIFTDYKIYPMPNCVSWLAGLTNIRGNLIPVYDLVNMLRLDVDQQEFRHLLVIDRGANSVGVLVQHLPLQLNVSSWKPVTHKARLARNISEHIKTTYSSDGVIWMDIDHNEFFRSIKEEIAL